jgi:uncharacterized membrane protein YfcA
MNELERYERNAKFEAISMLGVAGVLLFLGSIFLIFLFSQIPDHLFAIWPIFICFVLALSIIGHEIKWGKANREDHRAAIKAGMEMEAQQKALKEAKNDK